MSKNRSMYFQARLKRDTGMIFVRIQLPVSNLESTERISHLEIEPSEPEMHLNKSRDTETEVNNTSKVRPNES